jgi:virginiamycin B lyase
MKRLFYLCLSLFFLSLLLVGCSDTGTQPGGNGSGNTSTTSITVITGNFQEYPLPQKNSSLMRPAIDHEGRIWFGEMGKNYLAVFDPRTKTFQQMTPPHGHYGIMGIVVAADDTIWFAEQTANYIGHYFPRTRQFQVYPLPTLSVPDPGNAHKTVSLPSAPNDLALDTHGNVWFTELNADSLAMLDVHTGTIKQFPLSANKSVQKLDPYGITVDPQGFVWFTESSNTRLGRLDPQTGQISYFSPPGLNDPLMEVVSDTQGNIWATSFSSGLLLSYNPHTHTFKPHYATIGGESAGGVYGVAAAPNGEIWLAVTSENAIASLDVTANSFTFYPVPTQASLPFGLVMAPNHTIWFTEAGSDQIGMLQL